MAQKTVVELLDDIDGKPADETVTFALDGVDYEIDLSAGNVERLRKSLMPFVEKARKVQGGGLGRSVPSSQGRERSADVRAWAKRHGIEVNDRGRIPAQVGEAYEANEPNRAKAQVAIPQVTFKPGL